jgi:hypothetical protein
MDTLKERQAKVQKWFDDCDTRNRGVKTALYRAASMLFDRQTADEQRTDSTRMDNGIGFNSADAGYMSWVVKTFFGKPESMPNKTAIKLKFRLRKYSRQIASIALDNESR